MKNSIAFKDFFYKDKEKSIQDNLEEVTKVQEKLELEFISKVE